MPTPNFDQIPIRLRLSTASNPPIAPIDQNTGIAPAAWRANTIALQLGFFLPDAQPANLTGISYLQVILQDSEDALGTLVVKQINSADITALITTSGWNDGSAQNAAALFTAANMDQALGGAAQKAFWIVVVGYTAAGAPIIFGAGEFTIRNASSNLPAPSRGYVSRDAQTTVEDDFTVAPLSQVHTEIVTVEGEARTSKCILGILGVEDGARLTLRLKLPVTPNIVINVKSGLGTTPTISTWTTDGETRDLRLAYYFDADLAAWVPDFYLSNPV